MTTDNPFAKALLALAPETPSTHYEMVGRFITSFAAAEAAVHMLARKLSGMPDDKARIVFGGMRLPDLAERIRGIVRIDKIDDARAKDIDACLGQLSAIADRRHKLVHRSSNYIHGTLLVTDILTTKVLPGQVDRFPRLELEAMYNDCVTIYLRLTRAADPSLVTNSDDFWLDKPWRYKSSPPKIRGPRPRKGRKERKRQRPA